MTVLLIFAVTLVVAVMISELTHRTILSTAVLFLLSGFLMGSGGLGLASIGEQDEVVLRLAELALFAILFTDGMRAGVRDLSSAWRLPGRALLFGLPLTMLLTAVLARFVVGLPWLQAFLVGAILAPTDPVFASALIGREEVPTRIRRLLQVEAGVNDGLALPVVLVLISLAHRADPEAEAIVTVGEAALGVALGIAIPWAMVLLERSRFLAPSTRYEPLNAFAIGLLVLSLSLITDANEFLAAFAAGVTVATVSPEVRDAFHRFGDLVAELLKLAALLVFGALISPELIGELGLGGAIFTVLALVAVRPAAIGIALLGSGVRGRQWVAAAWFGPRGFASVVYGLLVLGAAVPRGGELFHLVALVVGASIVAHSSTDVLVARWFRGADPEETGKEPDEGGEEPQPQEGGG